MHPLSLGEMALACSLVGALLIFPFVLASALEQDALARFPAGAPSSMPEEPAIHPGGWDDYTALEAAEVEDAPAAAYEENPCGGQASMARNTARDKATRERAEKERGAQP